MYPNETRFESISEQIISCEWSELFVGQNNLVEIGGVMWDLTSTNSEQLILMSNFSNINSSDLGIPEGRIIAAGCDGIWIENEQILYVWNSTNLSHLISLFLIMQSINPLLLTMHA